MYISACDLGGYSVEVTKVADLDALYGHTNGPRRDRQSRQSDAVRWIVRIEQDTDAREVRYRELEKIEPLTNIGKEEAKPGDDPTVIAKRILRRGRAQRDFFRPINYPPLSLV